MKNIRASYFCQKKNKKLLSSACLVKDDKIVWYSADNEKVKTFLEIVKVLGITINKEVS